MRRTTTALSITTLALTLASCGQMPTTPGAGTGAPSGAMVQVRLGAVAPALQNLSQKAVTAQGLPAGAPLARIKVTVRDSSNNPVYFVNGTYAPSGANTPEATSTLVLDAASGWGKTVLLPKGQYSFENAGKYEDGLSDVLLSYGPAHENQATLDAQNNVVQLKFHGVIDPMKSRLDFAMQTSTIYTNDEVHLKLYANTAEIYGQSFPLPLSDIFMGNMGMSALATNANYTLADYASAEFMGPGSARGVDLIARGTAQNPNLSVTPHFRAYVRQGGSDVAQLQSIELPAFEHAIETQAVVADVERPYDVTLTPFKTATAGQVVTLMGTAFDNNAVTGIDVYEGSTLIATSDGRIGNLVRTDSDGNWQADWTARAGTHELTVVARDAAGNESEASQTVSVAAPSQQTGDLYFNPYTESYTNNLILNPGQTVWIQADLTAYYNSGLWYFQAYDQIENGVIDPIAFSVHQTPGGDELPYEGAWSGDYDWGSRRYVWSENTSSQVFWVKLTNTGTTPWNYSFDAGSSHF